MELYVEPSSVLVDIGLAYLLTEEEIYKRYLTDFLQAFIEHNPLNEQTKGAIVGERSM